MQLHYSSNLTPPLRTGTVWRLCWRSMGSHDFAWRMGTAQTPCGTQDVWQNPNWPNPVQTSFAALMMHCLYWLVVTSKRVRHAELTMHALKHLRAQYSMAIANRMAIPVSLRSRVGLHEIILNSPGIVNLRLGSLISLGHNPLSAYMNWSSIETLETNVKH